MPSMNMVGDSLCSRRPLFRLIAVRPSESVKTSLSFLAPANARGLYRTGDEVAMPCARIMPAHKSAP